MADVTTSQPDPTSNPVTQLLDWLISMDNIDDPSGIEARRTVTLTQIIDRARDTRRWLHLATETAPESLPYNPDSGPRLWETDHPYYGADGYESEVSSFAELRAFVNDMDEDMNLVYRWDWHDYRQPHHDDLFLDGDFRDKQELRVYWLMPRKSQFGMVKCPITHDQEADVYEWLSGPRCLGHLRKVWAPLIGDGRG